MSNNHQAHFWSELPAEILHYTLLKIDDKNTIIQCLYVCKSWGKSAERVVYNTLNFTSYVPQLQKFVATVESARHLGKHVNTLNFNNIFNCADGPWDPSNLFSRLSDYCPNVQTITTAESCPSLWLRLIVERHKWKKLKKTPVPKTWEEVQLYATVAMAFRDRLTELLILNDPEDTIQLRKMYNPLISNLSRFKSLTLLKLHKANDVNIYEIDDLISECSKLTSLILPYTPPVDNEPAPRTATIPRFSTKILNEIKLMKPKPNLKELSMNVSVNGGDESLNYIMHVFPNLTNIQFNKDIGTLDSNQNIIYSKSVLTSFLRYITSKDKYDVQYFYTEDVATVLSNYWQSEEFKAKEKPIFLNIKDSNFSVGSDRPYLKVKDTEGVSVMYRSLEDSPTAPELLEKIGRHVYKLCIRLEKNVLENQQDLENLNKGYILDYIFEHCASLHTLECNFRELQYCRPELAVNTSIKILKIFQTCINLDVLYQLSVRLPNLRHLVLKGNKIVKHGGAQFKGKRFLINMPHTELQSLDIFSSNIRGYEQVYLKYSTENGDKYFFGNCSVGSMSFQECPYTQYESKLTIRSCYFVNLRFKRLDLLRYVLGSSTFIHTF